MKHVTEPLLSEQREIWGIIKWFDPGKGFGFILDPDGGPDILLHANILRNFGQSSIADGARLRVEVQQTQRGLQAAQVLEILPPENDGAPAIADLGQTSADDLDKLPFQPARVKWFDKAKGFGFANVFGAPDDVFLHIEVLRHSGFAELAVGEAIALRVVEGKRGLMAAQIASWEQLAREPETATLNEADAAPLVADA